MYGIVAKRSAATNLEMDLSDRPSTKLEHSRLISGRPDVFVFCLLPSFSMLSLCSAIETLRIANDLSGTALYSWSFIGDGALNIQSSIGLSLPVGAELPSMGPNDVLFVCGGANVEQNTTAQVLNWLRKSVRYGSAIGGLCTGTYAIAKAGLLNGKSATIHWENQHSLREMFPGTEVSQSPIEVDDHRFSTAGGVSSIDLMLKLIADRNDKHLAERVSEQLMYTNVHVVQTGTTIDLADRNRVIHPKLNRVVKEMEQNVENPISVETLAQLVNISTRQLERLFRRHLDQSPVRYYLQIRLDRAHALLHQTDMSILEVALACGFVSNSHFSKNYRKTFGVSPNHLRRA